MSNTTNDLNITPQDIEDAARFLLYACGAFSGGNRSIIEMLGSAVVVLSTVALDDREKQNNESKTDISKDQGSEGASAGSRQVPESGAQGRPEESPEGSGETEQAKA